MPITNATPAATATIPGSTPSPVYVFEGTIQAEQPLATASADLIARERADKHKALPIPTTHLKDGVHLMFPATGLKGKIRRCARDVVRNAMMEKTGNVHPLSLDEHYLLTLGGIKGKGEQQRSSISQEQHWRTANPLLSLFGAGDAGFLGFMQGRLSIGNAIAENNIDLTPATILGSGVRSDDFYRDKEQVQYLSNADVSTLITRAEGGRDKSQINKQIKTLTSSLIKARKKAQSSQSEEDAQAVLTLTEEIAALTQEKEEVSTATGTSDVSISMPLPGWKAIPAGTVMNHKMIGHRLTPVELGLLLKSLAHFALQEARVGAHLAAGCGEISAQWEVFEVTSSGKKSVGSVTLKPWDGAHIDGALLHSSIQAFEDFIASDVASFVIPHA